MSIIKANIEYLLPLIAILAFFALASSHPSRSAIILLVEAVIIDIYLALAYGIGSTVFGASVLLTFFCLIVFGGNYYLRKIVQKNGIEITKTQPSNCDYFNGIILALCQQLFCYSRARRAYSLSQPQQ